MKSHAILVGIAALFLATGTAHAIEVKGLPEEWTLGTWRTCQEFPENNDDGPREIFAPNNGRECKDAGFALYLWDTGYSGPGRGICNFEKIEKIGNAYQVYANCNIGNPYSARTEHLELEIIDGYLVVTSCATSKSSTPATCSTMLLPVSSQMSTRKVK